MSKAAFRDFLPQDGHPRLGGIKFQEVDAHEWVQWGLKLPMVQSLWEGWQSLYAEPYRGITVDGQLQKDLFELRSEGAPTEAMKHAADLLLKEAENVGVKKTLCYDIDAREWRSWMNPEFYLAKYGLRFEEHPESIRDAALGLIEASLSKAGYEKVLSSMATNHFLGELVGAPKLMNDHSYNFIVFGQPSTTTPWGWLIYGHHLTVSVFVLGSQMVVTPVFFGCEPNQIDEGSRKGTVIFDTEMRLATQMMQTLTEEDRQSVIVYDKLDHPDMPEGFPHPADGRNLAGAYEDNKVIPFSGGNISKFSKEAQEAVFALTEQFIAYMSDGVREAKMKDIRQHLDQTWLMWMGKCGDDDVFHFRIHSPVILVEFDHECGMYLTNNEPGRFHVHTVVRTPNGNDYGKELLRQWRAKQ